METCTLPPPAMGNELTRPHPHMPSSMSDPHTSWCRHGTSDAEQGPGHLPVQPTAWRDAGELAHHLDALSPQDTLKYCLLACLAAGAYNAAAARCGPPAAGRRPNSSISAQQVRGPEPAVQLGVADEL